MSIIGDFIFSIRFTVKEKKFSETLPKLLELELDNLVNSSSRFYNLQIQDEGNGNIAISVHANDIAGFKIAANSINRYIEIIGKVIEMVQKAPA